MKLLSASVGLVAMAHAAANSQYIPFDCYQPSGRVYGNARGNVVSDKDVLSGLDQDHELVQISGCVDTATKTLTGLVSTWAKWSSGNQTDKLRLNIVGNMSSLYEYDHNSPITAAGLSSLSSDQLVAFESYWYQEANVARKEAALQTKSDNNDSSTASAWRQAREIYFDEADSNNNGKLTRDEATAFLTAARAADGKTGPADADTDRLDRHFAVLASLSGSDDSFDFDDYVLGEQIMQYWYEDGKLEATGHAYGDVYDYDVTDPNKVYTYGTKLTTQCHTFDIAENDQVTYMRIQSGDQGVANIALQTIEIPETFIGGSNDWYSYQDENWLRFDNGMMLGGFWGYTDKTTGKLNALGVINHDIECTNSFINDLGANNLSWTSIKSGTTAEEPSALDDSERPEIAPQHVHDDKGVDPGLIVVCFFVYLAIAVLMVMMIMQYCKEKKEGNQTSPNRA